MDASTLKVAATGVIHVKDAAGAPLYDGDKPVRITVHAPGSRAYGAVESRQTARTIRRMNENEGKYTTPTAEERLAETAEDLADIAGFALDRIGEDVGANPALLAEGSRGFERQRRGRDDANAVLGKARIVGARCGVFAG